MLFVEVALTFITSQPIYVAYTSACTSAYKYENAFMSARSRVSMRTCHLFDICSYWKTDGGREATSVVLKIRIMLIFNLNTVPHDKDHDHKLAAKV